MSHNCYNEGCGDHGVKTLKPGQVALDIVDEHGNFHRCVVDSLMVLKNDHLVAAAVSRLVSKLAEKQAAKAGAA